ncbi:unnamed protein product, partial [Mesorhabditis belari]|uniref:Akirin n=1 Tax=Mesorhabditis belari TaxID=2138241 RepID=A0AAF3EST5_9BILA
MTVKLDSVSRTQTMACGLALKRPHEYDNYLQLGGDATATPEVKRSRTSPLSCSPFRAQMGTMAASLPSSSSSVPLSLEENGSVFTSATSVMSREGVDAFLKAEMRSLRRRKLIPKRCLIDNNSEFGTKGDVLESDAKPTTHPTSNYRVPGSPQSSSDSEGELSGSTPARRRVLATLPSEVATPVTDLYKKPMYSLNQVVMMCERLLKEQEMRIRFEYQQVLEKKLTEQQDQLSQLAAEAGKPTEDYSCSYLS